MTTVAVVATLLLIGCAGLAINRGRYVASAFYMFAAIGAALLIGN